MQNLDDLSKKIEDLPFTERLKAILKAHNMHTLKDVVDMPVYDWHKKIIGFNYHCQHEIVSYLMKNDLDDFLKED